MAQRPIIETITVNNTTYDIADSQARQMVVDVPSIQSNVSALQSSVQNLQNNKVSKSGDTMSGDLQMEANKKIVLKRASTGGTASVEAADNVAVFRAVDADDEFRAVKIFAPNGQAKDDQGLEYVSSVGGNTTYYKVDSTVYNTFSGTALTAISRAEYTNNTAIASLTITWPTGYRGLIFGVNFTSGSSFSGVTHRNSSGTNFIPRYIGSKPTKTGKRYNLVCWYDGNNYWVASAEADS